MRIERQMARPSAGAKKAQSNNEQKAPSFQQTLAAKRTEDVLTLSRQPAAEEMRQKPSAASMTASTAPAGVKEQSPPDEIVLLPGDSTETKLEKLRQIADTADYTGMSYTEIYCDIWNRYNEAFGGKMSAITSGLWRGDNWYSINNQFSIMTDKFVFYPLDREIFKDSGLSSGDKGYHEQYVAHGGKNFRAAALGYQVDNFEDCELAIRLKYAGKNTLLDFLNMQGELFATGVMDHKLGSEGAFWYQNDLEKKLQTMFFPDPWAQPTSGQYIAALRFQVDVPKLAADMRQSLSQANFSGFNFDIEEVMDKAIDDLLSIADEQ